MSLFRPSRTLVFAVLAFLPAGVLAVEVHGHRGARGLYPENTMPGFRAAIELRVTTLELDIQLTADRQLVVYHDRALNRSLCRNARGRRVRKTRIADLTYQELQSIDCGSVRHKRFPEQTLAPGTGIPLLRDVLRIAEGAAYPVRVSIEIKGNRSLTEPTARLLVALVRESELSDRILVQSFDPRALKVLRDLAPSIERSALVKKRRNFSRMIARTGANVLSPKHARLRAKDVRKYQDAGLRVIPWTVNKPKDIRRMISIGVDGIISDYPDRVIKMLAEP